MTHGRRTQSLFLYGGADAEHELLALLRNRVSIRDVKLQVVAVHHLLRRQRSCVHSHRYLVVYGYESNLQNREYE